MFDALIDGITGAYDRFESHSAAVGRFGTDQQVQLEREIVGSQQEKHAISLLSKAIRVQDETIGSLLDIIA